MSSKTKGSNTVGRRDILAAIADDHTIVREGIVTLLESMGGIRFVLKCDSGTQLLEALTGCAALPEICILDIEMPGNGFETTEHIKSRYPDIKILVVSAHMESDYAIKLRQIGADSYLSKGCHPAEIMKAISINLAGGDYFMEFDGMNLHADGLPQLSEMEMKLFQYADCGRMSWKQIAAELGITIKSLEGHRENLYRKLEVTNRSDLLMKAIRYGVIEITVSGARLI